MSDDGAATGRKRPGVPMVSAPGVAEPRPLAYFLTWTCYGTWLHGDSRTSVDRTNNAYQAPKVETDPRRQEYERQFRLKQRPMLLEPEYQGVVDEAIRDACAFRGWSLHALNVRSNHVHVVVDADEQPEIVMTKLKARATRALREADMIGPSREVWTRHGSTKWLWRPDDLRRVCWYVEHGQGDVITGDKTPYEKNARPLPPGRGSAQNNAGADSA